MTSYHTGWPAKHNHEVLEFAMCPDGCPMHTQPWRKWLLRRIWKHQADKEMRRRNRKWEVHTHRSSKWWPGIGLVRQNDGRTHQWARLFCGLYIRLFHQCVYVFRWRTPRTIESQKVIWMKVSSAMCLAAVIVTIINVWIVWRY